MYFGKLIKLFLFLSILFVLSFFISGCDNLNFDESLSGVADNEKELTEKQCPMISCLIADSVVLEINQSTVLTCFATDPTNDPLLYTWDESAGKINGNASIVTWKAPDKAGNYTISCVVCDCNGMKDSRLINILVKDNKSKSI